MRSGQADVGSDLAENSCVYDTAGVERVSRTVHLEGHISESTLSRTATAKSCLPNSPACALVPQCRWLRERQPTKLVFHPWCLKFHLFAYSRRSCVRQRGRPDGHATPNPLANEEHVWRNVLPREGNQVCQARRFMQIRESEERYGLQPGGLRLRGCTRALQGGVSTLWNNFSEQDNSASRSCQVKPRTVNPCLCLSAVAAA
jgi:hypothetical protein